MNYDLFSVPKGHHHDEQDNSLTQKTMFHQGQIRLAELSVFNWGSFHGLHTATIDPDGTLVTGDNGAGKSTLIDGLMALLLPAGKAAFNVAAAQGDRSDRSLLSYMRGSFGSVHDGSATRIKNKREKGVVTGLRAYYKGEDGSAITLAALFWTTSASNSLSDVKRLYLVAKRNISLKTLLEAFGDGNIRQLKQWLRNDPTITDCDSNFSDYQELYRKLLHMDNKNAPALLARALGLKKIDDLTKLIRELVLEPSTIKEDARKVVDEFADLVAIHDQLIDAKEQHQHLNRLPELAQTISKASESLQNLQQEKTHLPIYFAEKLTQLWHEKLAYLTEKLVNVSREIADIETRRKDTQAAIEKRHAEYLNLGGDKIEELRKDVAHTQEKLNAIISESSKYQQDCQKLALDDHLDEATFQANRQTAEKQCLQMVDLNQQRLEYFAEAKAQHRAQEQKLNDSNEEIEKIRAHPNSNIDVRFQKLRDEMITSLGISSDELVFIGELIDVKDSEKKWQGAIERALGGLRTTLLMPQHNYSMVTRWLNIRHTGLHVRAQVVTQQQINHPSHTSTEFSDGGYLRKLLWKEHPYRDWLKQHLEKFDLRCVSGTDELDTTPYSITKEGLIHKERGRFEKKDQQHINDQRYWYLGFSNQARLALLTNIKKEQQTKLNELNTQLNEASAALDTANEQIRLWEKISNYNWDQIDAPYWQRRLAEEKQSLAQLEQASGNLDMAKKRWEQAKEELQTIDSKKTALNIEQGGLETQKLEAVEKEQYFCDIAASGMTDDIRHRLSKRITEISLEQTQQQSDCDKALDHELEKIRNHKNKAENSANNIMGSFRGKDKWQTLTVDWPTGLDGLNDYLAHFSYIESEGLPTLIDKFKERLNKHATQSLARIKTKLESEREEILERIATINEVLKRTEFKQGSHLKLGSKREQYPHVIEFERKVREALSQVTSDNHEARFTLLADIVQILEKASATVTANTMESLRLLDPRYKISFYAEEVDTQTLDVRDVLESSSGKSGGEKESFAGTIVAASLAYVLTPDGHDKPIYCTVFLDEAFSNTAEAVSRRVLRVFKELHIHVNLITPYKNLNLARESARSLLIAERDTIKHESHLCEVTWEEIDRRMAQQKQLSTQAEIKLSTIDTHQNTSHNHDI